MLTTRIDVTNRMVGGRTIALVVFTPPAGGLISWTREALAAVAAAVRGIDLASVDAVAFTGTGAVFGAGADLAAFGSVATHTEGEQIARDGYTAFNQIGRLGLPTFAFLNGVALGGAFELALCADYRTVAATATNLGLPEVRLGLVPGWGGLSLLADLIGAGPAAEIAVTRSLSGRSLTAADIAALGVADAVIEDPDFIGASLAWAAGVLNGRAEADAADTPADLPTLSRTVAQAAWQPEALRAAVRKRIPGELPAVEKTLELLSTWQHRNGGRPASAPAGRLGRTAARLARGGDPIEAETIVAFGELLQTDECRAGIYAFFTLQAARKRGRPGGPGAVSQVGVVGGGRMATQLALVFAERLGVPVRVTDLTPEQVAQALDCIADQLGRAVKRGTMTPGTATRVAALITGTSDITDLAGSDIVIEAVFEDLAVKRGVWESVERVVRPDTLLLTNTSSLSIADQGSALLHPERLIGFHFFNPVAVLPLVEIVRAPRNTDAVVAAAFALAGALGKTAVLVKDSAGFVVNRLITRWFSDTLRLIDAGADARLVDDALVADGFPMTPLTLIRHIGPPVQLHILAHLGQCLGDRFTVSPSLRRLVQLSLPSYVGPDGRLTPAAADAIQSILPSPVERAELPVGTAAVRAMLLHGLADEAGRMLADGTVQSAADIDACMILGANFPHHTGGLTPLLDRSGAALAARGTLFHP
ncbi:3-hydroxyacyl-CoA dehydrogenase [Cryobacterium algoritolerans]|uniref:3-hydroxyacyl-CoA dehydrogenase n=1 Tax=Cryobacterium algoritolerans TaxID=1259184 RepID=A0A4R8WP67_9MICO|nr:3-hydroxyacyl-CoA dehydrogenase NAD-binding domain-containing protein [Cryobacterium algoritolerans]TFC13226.1 3-hydroxyacyl-CoA dehydrogenase [Cryobacterium algoritolerans]